MATEPTPHEPRASTTEDVQDAIEQFFECPACRRPIPSGGDLAEGRCPECGTPVTDPDGGLAGGGSGPASGDAPPPG